MSAGEIDRVERELLAADGASLAAIARRIREQIDDVALAAVLRYRDEIIDYATGVTLHDDYAVVVARPEETHTEHVLRSSPYADRLLTDALGPRRAYDDRRGSELVQTLRVYFEAIPTTPTTCCC